MLFNPHNLVCAPCLELHIDFTVVVLLPAYYVIEKVSDNVSQQICLTIFNETFQSLISAMFP